MNSRNKPIVNILLPCYNESEILADSIHAIQKLLDDLIFQSEVSANSFISCVDDGSKDGTWEIILGFDKVKGIKLSKNFGHQNAVLAGINVGVEEADLIVSIDADLQDDINAIPKMIQEYKKGSEIVYGVRNDRTSDTYFKKTSANLFYFFQEKLGVDAIKNHADFRLMSKKACLHLLAFPEKNLYLRAMIPLIGYNSSQVFYARKPRMAGESKYPLKKMLAFAWNGITSFSTIPLKAISLLGLVIFICSIFMIIWIVYSKLALDNVQGWASTNVSIFFLGGIQLLSIGVIGEYLGKIYKEVKQRPSFFIETIKSQN